MKSYRYIKQSSLLLLFVFVVNFIWEISQMFLYKNHTAGFIDFISVHIRASLGDVVLFGIIYIVGSVLFCSSAWFLQKRASVYIFTILSGFAIAVIIEKYALATGRWEYDNLMPIIPVLKVGLSPILQLAILPLFAIFFAKKTWANKTKMYSEK